MPSSGAPSAPTRPGSGRPPDGSTSSESTPTTTAASPSRSRCHSARMRRCGCRTTAGCAPSAPRHRVGWSTSRSRTSSPATRRAGSRTSRGSAGSWARRGMRCRGSTSRSPARFRSGPGCRARRPSSARWSPPSPTCSASASSTTTPAGPAPRHGASAPRTRSPGRRPAGWTRPRRCGRRRTTRSSSTAGREAVEQIPVRLGSHGLALLVVDTRAEHALVDGQYAARRTACEEAAGILGVETLREVDPARPGHGARPAARRRLPRSRPPCRHRDPAGP